MRSSRYPAIFRLVRLQSTCRNEILPLLSSPESLSLATQKLQSYRNSNAEFYHEILTHETISKNSSKPVRKFADDVIKISEANLGPTDLVGLYNTMIKRFTRDDFSTSAIYKRKILSIENGELDFDARIEIIKYNPGRVQSSWDLYLEVMSFRSSFRSGNMEKLHVAIVEKLLYGDASQIEDGYSVTVSEMAKILTVLRRTSKALPYDLESRAVHECARLNILQALKIIQPRSSIASSMLRDSSVNNLSSVWAHIKDPYISIETAIDVIPKLIDDGKSQEDVDCLVKEMIELDSSFDPAELLQSNSSAFRSFLHHVKDTDMDKGQEPMKAKLRQEILRTIGTRVGDLQSALKYSDSFQDEQLLPIMASVWAYHAVKKGDSVYMKNAEKCLNAERLPLGISIRILGHGGLGNVQEALDLYNEHITKASKKSRVLMIESLVLSFLLNGDREFAQLIESGAIANKLIDDSDAKVRLKPLFKLYGDACEDEGKERLLRQELLGKLATGS